MRADHIQLIGTIIAFLALVVTIIKMWTSFVREHTKLQEKVLENEKDIANHYTTSTLELEKFRKEEHETVDSIYGEIENLRKMREADSKEFLTKMDRMVDKLQHESRQDHKELMERLDKLSTQVTQVCATFDEYRKTRNGGEKKK